MIYNAIHAEPNTVGLDTPEEQTFTSVLNVISYIHLILTYALAPGKSAIKLRRIGFIYIYIL